MQFWRQRYLDQVQTVGLGRTQISRARFASWSWLCKAEALDSNMFTMSHAKNKRDSLPSGDSCAVLGGRGLNSAEAEVHLHAILSCRAGLSA